MTIFGESNRVRLAYIEETDFGVLPTTPTLQIMRVTGSDINASKEAVTSNEIRSDRMRSDNVEVAAGAAGSVNIELSMTTFDDLLEAVLCGTWSTAVSTTVADADFSITNQNRLTSTSAVAAWANLSVDQWIYVSGLGSPNASANGWHRVAAVVSGTGPDYIQVAGTPFTNIVADANNAAVVIKGKTLRNGTERSSFSIEQAHLDLTTPQYILFTGMRPSTLALDVSSGAIVTGSIGFTGSQGAIGTSANGTAYTAATSTPVVNATANVGSVTIDGAALTTAIQKLSISLDNGLREQRAVGNKYVEGIGYGSQTITGNMTAYWADASLYDKFINHTSMELSFVFSDSSSRRLRITIPNIKITTSTVAPGGIDQDVMQEMQFAALKDETLAYQIQFDYIA